MLTQETLDHLLLEAYRKPMNPATILIDGKRYAGMKAMMEFQGRDRRRLKREFNRAWRKARKEELSHPRGPVLSLVEYWNLGSTRQPTSANT